MKRKPNPRDGYNKKGAGRDYDRHSGTGRG